MAKAPGESSSGPSGSVNAVPRGGRDPTLSRIRLGAATCCVASALVFRVRLQAGELVRGPSRSIHTHPPSDSLSHPIHEHLCRLPGGRRDVWDLAWL
jgi:hypothetical protein